MEPYLSADGLRAGLVLALAIAQPVMGYWPQLRGWPETTPSRSARLRNPVVPIDWAFAIWGPIFASVIVFAIWQALPANLDDPLSRRIGWPVVFVCAANVAWEAWVPKRDLGPVSAAILWAELAALLAILFAVTGEAPEGARFWLVSAPFQLFAGWASAAAFVNTASTLQRAGVRVGTGLSAALLLGAGALGAGVAALTGGWLYAAAVAWALVGIVVANRVRAPNPAIARLAAALAVVVLAAPAV
jgi:hypothetical protein